MGHISSTLYILEAHGDTTLSETKQYAMKDRTYKFRVLHLYKPLNIS